MNTEAQQDLQMLHRIRHRLVGERTALINQIRGLLGEYGIVFAQGPGQVRRGLVRILGDNEPGLSGFAWSFSPTCTSSCASSTKARARERPCLARRGCNGLPVMCTGTTGLCRR